MTDTLAESWKLTKKRYATRNRLTKNGRRVRLFIETPLGRAVANDFLKPLASFLAGDLADKPTPPPDDVGGLFYRLSPEDRAIAVLAPLLDCIYRGWEGSDTRSAEMLLRKTIGRNLRERLALKFDVPEWGSRQCVKAGAWLLEQALALPCFTEVSVEHPFPEISPEWQDRIDQAREDLLRRDQVLLPHISPPPDWTEWKSQYTDRLQATFVRDGHPETRSTIAAAFRREDFEHARGVNALQRVPLSVNEQLLPLVEQFAVTIMGHDDKQLGADERLVGDDLVIAKQLAGQPFYLTYNCDFRGRLNPIPHFNYAREDHVRALFKFANGARLGTDGLSWLEIHCANCEGSTDKKPWVDRIEWAAAHRREIQKIANDPAGTFDLWRKADAPFQYVAACIELAAAWADPANFINHLPVAFDGSCNGIQHLALISGDVDAGRKVNLIDSDSPKDIYGIVAAGVKKALETDSSEWAQWWRSEFEGPLWGARQIRKLVKQPVMTFPYNVTVPGMTGQVREVYAEITKTRLDFRAARYLAERVKEVSEENLRGPAEAMRYICSLAKHCADHGAALEWTSPTGFPVRNLYQKPNLTTAYIGARKFRVADGYLPGIVKKQAVNASAPNFVHSLDASHLIRTINDAVETGIPDLLTVHDSFACLAQHAQEFGRIIRWQLAQMYWCYDALHLLRDRNYGGDEFPLPASGQLDPLAVQDSEYLFS